MRYVGIVTGTLMAQAGEYEKLSVTWDFDGKHVAVVAGGSKWKFSAIIGAAINPAHVSGLLNQQDTVNSAVELSMLLIKGMDQKIEEKAREASKGSG